MRMIPLNSKMLASIGYDPDRELLAVQFQQGRIYRYEGVPADAYVAVITARESHGKMFQEHIRSRAFPYQEIGQDDLASL